MSHAAAKNIRLVVLWSVIFALLFGVVSLLLPKFYSAQSQVLVISRDRSGIDPYTQAKAAERIGENLIRVLGTTDFYAKVMENPTTNINRDYWNNMTDRARRKEWQKDVTASVVYNTGLINITVYAPTADNAVALSQAVSDTLVSHVWEYVGGDVTLKNVNAPLASRLPARPNLIANMIAGLALGALFCAFWIWRAERG